HQWGKLRLQTELPQGAVEAKHGHADNCKRACEWLGHSVVEQNRLWRQRGCRERRCDVAGQRADERGAAYHGHAHRMRSIGGADGVLRDCHAAAVWSEAVWIGCSASLERIEKLRVRAARSDQNSGRKSRA